MKTTTQDKARALAARFAENFSFFAQESVSVTVADSGAVLARCASMAGKEKLLAQNAAKDTYKVRTSDASLSIIFRLP